MYKTYLIDNEASDDNNEYVDEVTAQWNDRKHGKLRWGFTRRFGVMWGVIFDPPKIAGCNGTYYGPIVPKYFGFCLQSERDEGFYCKFIHPVSAINSLKARRCLAMKKTKLRAH